MILSTNGSEKPAIKEKTANWTSSTFNLRPALQSNEPSAVDQKQNQRERGADGCLRWQDGPVCSHLANAVKDIAELKQQGQQAAECAGGQHDEQRCDPA